MLQTPYLSIDKLLNWRQRVPFMPWIARMHPMHRHILGLLQSILSLGIDRLLFFHPLPASTLFTLISISLPIPSKYWFAGHCFSCWSFLFPARHFQSHVQTQISWQSSCYLSTMPFYFYPIYMFTLLIYSLRLVLSVFFNWSLSQPFFHQRS